MEAGALAQVPVVRLQDLGGGGVGHQLLDPAPVGFHDLVVELLATSEKVGQGHALGSRRVVDGGVVMRPSVVHLVDLGGAAHHDPLEVVHPGPLPAGLEPVGEAGIGGPVASLADGRRRALEHVEVLGRFDQRGHALDATRSGSDEGDDFVGQAGERLVRAAAGVAVVPPGGVERAPGEVLHARDGGELHEIEDPHGQDIPAAADLVAPVGADAPASRVLFPLGPGHPGVEQGIVHQVEPIGDGLEVAPDLLAEGVAPGGEVVELLEHRHVHVGLDVAHDPGVAVPVPGAPDATGLVDDADPLDAGLAEAGAGQDPGDSPAHHHHIDVVGDRVALDERRERVVPVAGEVLVDLQVPDIGPVGNQPLVALGEVFGPHRLRVVARRRLGSGHTAILPTIGFSTSAGASSVRSESVAPASVLADCPRPTTLAGSSRGADDRTSE